MQRTLLTVMLLAALTNWSHAQTFTENPASDAGSTLATADVTTSTASGGMLTTIYGTLGSNGTDSDLYKITITSPSTFSASTNNTLTNTAYNGGQPLDTSLFLFDASGHAIAANDDTSGSTVTSTLPAGNSLYANLTAGTFYLGISITGNEPINSVGQLLFATSDDTTAVRGAATGLNPTTENAFNQNNYDNETGSYQIDLKGTAAAAPEPTTWTMVVLGGFAAGYSFLRRHLTHS